MLKVNPNIKFPIERFRGKGSYQQRLEYAQKLNEQFYNIVKSNMHKRSISVTAYKKLLKDFLPKDIKVDVLTYKASLLSSKCPSLRVLTNGINEANGLTLILPCKKIPKGIEYLCDEDSNIITHETFHLFSSLSNPKHIARITFNRKEEEYFYQANMYTNIHSKFGFKEKRQWKKMLFNFIKDRDSRLNIDFLQNSRYLLLEEKLAYQEGDKFSKTRSTSTDYFYFDEKIKIIEKILYRIINLSRY